MALPIAAESSATDVMIKSLAHAGTAARTIANHVGLPLDHVIAVIEATYDQTGHRPATKFEIRFWSKVKKTARCWLWQAMTCAGYGRLRVGRTLVGAHQLAWKLYRGPIPIGLVVCHDCPDGDRPDCVNPNHLFLASQTENLRDGARKRASRNERKRNEESPESKTLEPDS